MESLWRWTTPSVFLLIALNAGRVLSQNVGQNSAGQLVLHEDYNPGVIQQNNLYMFPPNGIETGFPMGPMPECPKAVFQDGLGPPNPQNNPNQQIVPIASQQVPVLTVQAQQGPPYFGPTGPGFDNIPGPVVLSPQPIIPAGIFPIGPPTAGPPQQYSETPIDISTPHGQTSHTQAIMPGPSPTKGPPFASIKTLQISGIDLQPNPQYLPPLPPVNSAPVRKSSLSISPHFTPLIPVSSPSPITTSDMIPSYGLSQSALPVCPASGPLQTPKNQVNLGAPIDMLPLQGDSLRPIQSPSWFNGHPINTLIQPPTVPFQGSHLAASNTNCLPEQCDPPCSPLQETQSCSPLEQTPSSLDPALQPLHTSLISPFRSTRQSFFQPSTPLGSSVNALPAQRDPTLAGHSLVTTPGPVCAIPPLMQQEPIRPSPQLSVASGPSIFMQNIPPGINQNVPIFPLSPSCIPQPSSFTQASSFCPLTTDLGYLPYLPSSIVSQPYSAPPCGFGSILPKLPGDSTTMPNSFNEPCYQSRALPPVLPSSLNEPNICNSPSSCQSKDTVPIPINLEINLPAPIVPPPTITIINTTPPPTSNDGFSRDMPPIIVEGRRRSRSWIPLVLVALFAGNGDFGNYGYCNNNSGDSSPIPIPFPIPIPTNNQVIVKSSSRSSRNRGHK